MSKRVLSALFSYIACQVLVPCSFHKKVEQYWTVSLPICMASSSVHACLLRLDSVFSFSWMVLGHFLLFESLFYCIPMFYKKSLAWFSCNHIFKVIFKRELTVSLCFNKGIATSKNMLQFLLISAHGRTIFVSFSTQMDQNKSSFFMNKTYWDCKFPFKNDTAYFHLGFIAIYHIFSGLF